MRRLLPHGGSLPEGDWRSRHRLICLLLAVMIGVAAVYAVAEHQAGVVRYIPEIVAMVAFAGLACWRDVSRTWRSVSASMGLLTGSAALVDISGGLIEMHFSFFVVIVVLTLYEDWVPFLLAVAFVLIHHGVMGTIDPRAVFDDAGGVAQSVGLGRTARAVRRAGRCRRRDRLGAQRARPRAHAGGPAPSSSTSA